MAIRMLDIAIYYKRQLSKILIFLPLIGGVEGTKRKYIGRKKLVQHQRVFLSLPSVTFVLWVELHCTQKDVLKA